MKRSFIAPVSRKRRAETTNDEINRILATAFGCYEKNGQWVGVHGHYLTRMPDYVKSMGRKKALDMAMRLEAMPSRGCND